MTNTLNEDGPTLHLALSQIVPKIVQLTATETTSLNKKKIALMLENFSFTVACLLNSALSQSQNPTPFLIIEQQLEY
jgi:hypothetical protein